MKKIFSILALIFILAGAVVPSVSAQDDAPYVFDATIPVSDHTRDLINAWLDGNAPAPVQHYAITYVEPRGFQTFVSLAAIDNPQTGWHIYDENVVWIGSVLIHADETISLHSQPDAPAQSNAPRLASLDRAGGGSNIFFPWAAGATMMYGPAAVHAAGYGAYGSGYSAVDFVGGDDMGSGVAGPQVYAVAAGTVDYVCEDATSVMVRTTDGAGNNFIYAHLLDNANLAMSHAFTQGSMIGSLKYGAFDDTCGNADQQANHYHLHFGFQPASNAFRMEGCILSTTTEKWTCGTTTVSTGQFLRGGGGSGTNGGAVAQPSFWDYLLVGALSIYDQLIIKNLPNHVAFEFAYVIYSTVKLVLRLAFVLVYSNVNLYPLMLVMANSIALRTALGVAEGFVFLLKAFKSLFPAA